MLRRHVFIALLLGLALWLTPAAAGEPGGLFQVATIDSLLAGAYDGTFSFGELAKHGDFGLGTFHKLDGEMVAIDGRFYQVRVDGTVHPVSAGMTTPFANVTFFQADRQCACQGKMDYAGLKKCLDAALPSPNLFYAVRIDGVFPKVKVRSVPPATSKPYPTLVEMVKHQKVYEYRQAAGTLVGFYCPAFVKGVNVPGWHLHFIGKERKKGGHLLDADLDAPQAQLAVLSRLELQLPTQGGFLDRDLNQDRAHELDKVETGN